MRQSNKEYLAEFLQQHPRLTVLSGAGCSTASGIPEYRDDEGGWKHARPVQYADFTGSGAVRQRYWARSFVGWRRIAAAKPNDAHFALAEFEARGLIDRLVTQNVDNLHRAAGSRNVTDLHGILHRVRCLCCGEITSRADLQRELGRLNPDWTARVAGYAPDGDAAVDGDDVREFVVPGCGSCGGVLKPDVVFFGESVPRERVQNTHESLERSDGLLVVGSSLMVFSGYRFARQARAVGKPLAIINRGVTRADDLATHRFHDDCVELLSQVAAHLPA